MRQPRLDREHLAGGTDALDDLPARPWWREDPVGAAGDAEIRCADSRQAGEIVEAIGAQPGATHVPLHPFGDDLRRFVFIAEPQRAGGELPQRARHRHRRGRQRPPHRPEPPRARRPERDDRAQRCGGRHARQPTQAGGAARRVAYPGERRAVRFLAHARHQCRSIPQDPVFERPGPAARFAGALAMVAQVREPDIETGGAQKMRHAAGRSTIGGMQPHAVIGERAVHEQHRGPAVAVRAQPV